MSQDLTGTELKKRIAEILKDADLETTSAKKVRMQLEEETKKDLTSRKEEIGKLIQEVIDDMEDDEEEDEDEEEEKPKNGDIRSPNKNGASKRNASEDESEEETPTKKPARRAAAVQKSKYNEDSDSEESEFSEDEKPKKPKPSPNAGRGKYNLKLVVLYVVDIFMPCYWLKKLNFYPLQCRERSRSWSTSRYGFISKEAAS